MRMGARPALVGLATRLFDVMELWAQPREGVGFILQGVDG